MICHVCVLEKIINVGMMIFHVCMYVCKLGLGLQETALRVGPEKFGIWAKLEPISYYLAKTRSL